MEKLLYLLEMGHKRNPVQRPAANDTIEATSVHVYK